MDPPSESSAINRINRSFRRSFRRIRNNLTSTSRPTRSNTITQSSSLSPNPVRRNNTIHEIIPSTNSSNHHSQSSSTIRPASINLNNAQNANNINNSQQPPISTPTQHEILNEEISASQANLERLMEMHRDNIFQQNGINNSELDLTRNYKKV